MLYYGLPTNPSIEILSEITKIYDLGFDYVEIGIEGPEGNPHIINKKRKEIGIDLINFHANLNGMFYGENRRILLDNLIRSLREIIKYAEKSNVRVMLENTPLSNGIHKVNEIKYIIDNVPSLFVHLDVAHAFTSGGMESVIEYINTFRDKIIHIHWHDNHGSRDEHLPIGEGLIDHAKAVRALKDIDYDKTITLEVFTNSNDAKNSADKLRTIWAK